VRARLEADHGVEARDWRLALLPLLQPKPSSATVLVSASGGLLMTKKLLATVLALVLLVGGAVLIFPGVLRPSAHDRPESLGETQEGRQHQASAPVLVGRSGDARREGDGVPELDSGTDHVASGGPSEAENDTDWGDAMRVLLADIRRDVAPEWWGEQPDVAALEGRNGVVIARAPPDVLDGIGSYLDARRKGDPRGMEEPALEDQRAVDAARLAVRSILREMFEREQKIALAIAAWEKGQVAQAHALAQEVLVEESDNEYARAIASGTAAATASRTAGDTVPEELRRIRRRVHEARREPLLDAWVLRWPSARTWKALTSAFAEAGVSRFPWLAPELDALLDRGNVTVEIADASLEEAVRRLQIETFAGIRLSSGLAAEARRLRLEDFREESRPLGKILDELVRRLPEGWTWYAARTDVVLTRTGSEAVDRPHVRLRYFDVKDLLAPGSTPPVSSPQPEPGTPPMPPVYRPDPDGGPPVRVRER
jgi:hypothetical protein